MKFPDQCHTRKQTRRSKLAFQLQNLKDPVNRQGKKLDWQQ